MSLFRCSALVLAAVAVLAVPARADGPGLKQIVTAPSDEERDQNLIEGRVEHGGYGAPRLGYSRVAGHDAMLVGGEGAWIINHRFLIGGAAFGLVTDQPAPGIYADSHHLTMGYGGLMLGYTLLPHQIVHATFTGLVGGGGLGARMRMNADSNLDLGDAFFVFEPTMTVELNVARFFRLGAAVSYRLVRGVQTEGLTNSDLSGVFGSLVFKFGKF